MSDTGSPALHPASRVQAHHRSRPDRRLYTGDRYRSPSSRPSGPPTTSPAALSSEARPQGRLGQGIQRSLTSPATSASANRHPRPAQPDRAQRRRRPRARAALCPPDRTPRNRANGSDLSNPPTHEGASMNAIGYRAVRYQAHGRHLPARQHQGAGQRGGEAEGFSIPAQREACLRKAEALGAVVVASSSTRRERPLGQSARAAEDAALRRGAPSSYVIVHKVDRLARNRVDDVEINLQLTAAGAQLVSCSENIDETPSGMLLHGIMSSIAEFYSRNLATETKRACARRPRTAARPPWRRSATSTSASGRRRPRDPHGRRRPRARPLGAVDLRALRDR